MDKVQSKTTKTSRGFVYHYLFSEAVPGKPTLFFIHGFPSTSYDWYRQIDYFYPKGYGLVVPDLLGSGLTEPKSLDPADFKCTAVAQDLMDILHGEGVKNVIAVGHDWGSFIESLLAIKYQNEFIGFVFTALDYSPPGDAPPLEVMLKYQKRRFGRPLLGYWTFLRRNDAAALIEANIDSFLDILYPADPEVWKTYMNPPGALETFITQQRRLMSAPYLTDEHYDHITTALLQGGLDSPLNWYRSILQGVGNGIRATISDKELEIKKPVFMAVAKYDYVCEFDYAKMAQYTKDGLTVVELDAGHWPHLEKPEEYNDALDHWLTNTFES